MAEDQRATARRPDQRPAQQEPDDSRGPGWRVEPAPDGRGAPPEPKPPMIPKQRRGTFLAVIVALLVVNVLLSLATGQPHKSTRVPYTPFFLDQVNAGNVKEISSQDQSIQGKLKKAADFTNTDGKTTSVTDFNTQVPAFVNTDQLTNELQAKNVVVNASPPDQFTALRW